MTDEELIAMARLAQRDERMSTGALYGDLADRIEQLVATNEALTKERDEAWKRAAHAEKMWGEAEAKLAKAVEALERALKYNTAMHGGAGAYNKQIKDAIAELKGESHD